MLYSISCDQGASFGFLGGYAGCFLEDGSSAPGTAVPVSIQPESIDAQTNFTDGATLGWGVAAAMAAAWAVVHLRKALFR